MTENYLKIPLNCNRIKLTKLLSPDKVLVSLDYMMSDGSTDNQIFRIRDANQRIEFENMLETFWTLVDEVDDYKIYQRNY